MAEFLSLIASRFWNCHFLIGIQFRWQTDGKHTPVTPASYGDYEYILNLTHMFSRYISPNIMSQHLFPKTNFFRPFGCSMSNFAFNNHFGQTNFWNFKLSTFQPLDSSAEKVIFVKLTNVPFPRQQWQPCNSSK